MKCSAFLALAVTLGATARPARRADFTLKNGQDAIALNNKFKTLTPDSPCQAGENACISGKFAQCVGNKFVLTACGPSTVCAALPLVNSAGTSVTCTTPADRDKRIADTGAKDAGSSSGGSGASAASTSSSSAKAAATSATNVNNVGGKGGDKGSTTSSSAAAAATSAAGGNNGDPQKSLQLDPKNVAKGLEKDGQDQQEPGQVKSLTSSNNYINFCLGQTPTNGAQVKGGSCNQTPMGQIPSTANMVSSKFANPPNMGTIKANTEFTITMNIKGMQTGAFTNAAQTYYSAPQQVNKQGQIVGHSHVVVEKIDSLTSTKPSDPSKFAFFKGLNEPAKNGQLSADVAGGLPEGVYKVTSINAAANHQPVLMPVAQHGSVDDCVYFFVTKDGKPGAGQPNVGANNGANKGK